MRYYFLYFIIVIFANSCQQSIPANEDSKGALVANFDTLEKYQNAVEEREFAAHAGGNTKQAQKAVLVKGAQLFFKKNAVCIKFNKAKGSVGFTARALHLPETWGAYKALEITGSSTPGLLLQMKITGQRSWLADTVLFVETDSVFRVDLTELPLLSKPTPSDFCRVNLINVMPFDSSGQVFLKSIKLIPYSDGQKRPALIDAFGQRKQANWPGKITRSEQLKSSPLLPVSSTKPNRPAKLPTFKATGFYRVDSVGGTWWFVQPNGQVFWSLGVTGVRGLYGDASTTPIKGRAHLFDTLPPNQPPTNVCWQGDSLFSFYQWNILRKYGTLQQWAQTVPKRIEAWGFNSMGNWSDTALLPTQQLAYTHSFRTRNPNRFATGLHLPDVFNPKWPAYVDSIAWAQTQKHKNAATLLGYFVDNEIDLKDPRLIEADTQSYTFLHWKLRLRAQYVMIEALNAAWATDFKNFEQAAQQANKATTHAAMADILAFKKAFLEKYYSTISRAIAKHDPNHMYLGCRFTKKPGPDYSAAIAGKYCDVITVNIYSYTPTTQTLHTWYAQTGRPLLIGEHHLPVASLATLPPVYKAFAVAERESYYVNYVKKLATTPYVVGCHWYQFSDQYVSGRAYDGENQTIGVVTITDQPKPEILSALKTINQNYYNWHVGIK